MHNKCTISTLLNSTAQYVMVLSRTWNTLSRQHHVTRSGFRDYQTSLATLLFIEVPVTR